MSILTGYSDFVSMNVYIFNIGTISLPFRISNQLPIVSPVYPQPAHVIPSASQKVFPIRSPGYCFNIEKIKLPDYSYIIRPKNNQITTIAISCCY